LKRSGAGGQQGGGGEGDAAATASAVHASMRLGPIYAKAPVFSSKVVKHWTLGRLPHRPPPGHFGDSVASQRT
jgi:hypothetical protein